MDYVETFCRQIRTRSAEHRSAIMLLQQGGIQSQITVILRQELDSMIRVIYLLSLSDEHRRAQLMQASVEGRKWTRAGSRNPITDRNMLDLANKLQGWSKSVYLFGCGFIHLSRFHDYRKRDPMDAISSEEREAVLRYMCYYHGGPRVPNPRFADLVPYLPMVFEKISSNLESYLKDLEMGKSFDENEG